MNLIIFDFEGTLVDFQWKLKESIERMHRILEGYRINYNIPCDTEKFLKLDYAGLYNHFSKKLKDPFLRRKIMNDFDRIYDYYDEDAALRWNLYPKVHELLEELKKRNFKIALLSNVGRKALNKMFKKFSLFPYFDITISRNEVECLKPNPEGVLKIFEHFKDIYFEKRIYVGDSVTDIKTARSSKKDFKIIIVAHGEDKLERILKYKPDHIVQSVYDVINLV